MLKGSSFNNEVIDSNARATNAGGISEAQNKANALYSRLSGASFELVPSAYKEGTVYSGTGVNGDLSFTRAGDAWRTNEQGLIQRVPWNLLTYSEQFNNATWTKQNSTITVNTINSPNGTLTADKLVENISNINHNVLSQSITVTNNSNYSTSVYAKAGERNWFLIIYFDGTTIKGRYFNLTNGTGGQYWSGTTITNSITDVGNGWYRITLSFTTTSTSCIIGHYLASGDNNNIYLGDGTSGLYLWGAQLVEGTLPQNYFPTTDRLNVPRLDYSNGSSPSLLLEPQRTNLVLQSQNFSSATWVRYGAGVALTPVITANSGISPEGMNTATRIQFNCVGNTITDRSIILQTIAITNGINHASSFYIKAYSESEVGKQIRFVAENASNVVIVTLTKDWQRITTFATSTAVSTNFIFETRGTVTTNATADILLWGAQLEQGSFASTYIPTTTASATRLVDGFYRSNFFTNGIVTAAGGTWLTEFKNNISYIRDAVGDLQINDSLNSNLQIRFGNVPNRILMLKTISGANSVIYTTTTTTAKVLFKWNGTSVDVFVNGVKVVSASPFTITNFNAFNSSSSDAPRYIQQMAFFPTPLSDADCINLTSDYTDGSSITGNYERYVNNLGGTVENLNGVTNLIQNLK